ncbi:MAG: peptidylprolyl isomerase [Hyphomonadaceae bacterium]
MKFPFASQIAAGTLAAVLAGLGLPAVAQSTTDTNAAGQVRASDRGQAIEGVAVLVNDEVISYSDVRNRTRMILLSFGGQPDDDTINEASRQAVEGLIEEKIQVQEFKKLAKDGNISDQEIDQRIGLLARQNNSTAEAFVAGLQARGVNPQTLRDQVRADIAWTALVRGRFGRQVRVSETRVKEMMDRLQASLDKPQYRIAEIFLYAPDSESRTNAMTRADTLRRQIQQGASFEQVAQQFSAAPSASAGGDMGWMSPGDMRPEIETAVTKATPPALLPPIETEGGVYLVALLGKREPVGPGQAVLDLKQVLATGADAQSKLETIRTQAATCPTVSTAVQGVAGVTVNDLPGLKVAEMADAFKAVLEPLKEGDVSPVVDMGDDKMLLYVCSKTIAGGGMPSESDIRDRLFDQEISMLADRYLRDLKRDATIIRR